MRKILPLLLLVLTSLPLRAQDDLLQRIQAANSPASLQAGFTQVRHTPMLTEDLRSEGTVSLLAPDKLRWEVVRPVSRVTVFNGEIPSGRRFRMPEAKDFRMTSRSDGDALLLTLTPLRKDLKRMFSEILLRVDSQTLVVRDVRLTGTAGDYTDIEFHDIRTDLPLPESLFN